MNHKILNGNIQAEIEAAAQKIREGGVVAFPTETVYGLGASATDVKAVCRVFEIKKRPTFDPLIVHVAGIEDALRLWKKTPKIALALMEKFWPGPLSLVLPKSPVIPDIVTSDLPTVALRMPNHPVALEFIRLAQTPIAAPSANLFGYTSPTSAMAVLEDLAEGIDFVIDGGTSSVGIESTVLKIQDDECILLRPGGVLVEEIEKITPVEKNKNKVKQGESPGLLLSHYAPWTEFILMDKSYDEFVKELKSLLRSSEGSEGQEIQAVRVGLLSFEKKENIGLFESVEILSPTGDLYEAASNLFQAIRKLDKMNLDLIVAEPVPERGIGYAIMDRLKKASYGKGSIREFFEKRKDQSKKGGTS